MKHFVTLPYLLSMYLTSSGRGFLPLDSWDQAVTPVYIVLTAACSIQGKRSVWYTSVLLPDIDLLNNFCPACLKKQTVKLSFSSKGSFSFLNCQVSFYSAYWLGKVLTLLIFRSVLLLQLYQKDFSHAFDISSFCYILLLSGILAFPLKIFQFSRMYDKHVNK